jgi:uncharacterized protein (DUF1778 family)
MKYKNARVYIKTIKSSIVHLSQNEAERFISALLNPPKANLKLKKLFKKNLGTRTFRVPEKEM